MKPKKCKQTAILFAEWIGTEYQQDEGPVVGNVYYDRETGKEYDISQLWKLFTEDYEN